MRMPLTLCTSLLSLFILTMQPPEPPTVQQAESQYFKLQTVRVIDGDTVDADIVILDMILPHRSIRANNYDAWEASRARRTVKVTDEELRKGALAKDAFVRLLSKSKTIYVKFDPKLYGVYGRMSASFWLEMPGERHLLDVAKYMKENGHARTSEETARRKE